MALIVREGDIEDEDSCEISALLYERLDEYGKGNPSKFLGKSPKLQVDDPRKAQFIERGKFLRLDLSKNEDEKLNFFFYYVSPNFVFIKIGVMQIENPRLMGYKKGSLVFRGLDVFEVNYLEVSFEFPYNEFIDERGQLR